MKQRLVWKLLLINILPVIGVIVLVVWLAIDQLAADYFMALMQKYSVPTEETHRMFLQAVHRYLFLATGAALALALLLSFLLTRRVLRPLDRLTELTREIGQGRFSGRVEEPTQDEFGALGEAFNRMADSLQQVEQLRKTMVADLAHELRTPLTNLRGYMEGFGEGVVAPTPETFAMLQQETMRLVKLVEDLQQLARADAARAYLQRQDVDLLQLLDQCLGIYRGQFEAKGISVTRQFEGESLHVAADPDKLLQALRNLLENAWQYTPAGGNVRILASLKGGEVEICVANSGVEIAADDLPFIFERFFRADRSRSRPGGGAGIGLAIVKQLIEAHGGRVGANSGNGETRIWFTLPIA